jgi:hypothetical protein
MRFHNVAGESPEKTDAILREELTICGIDIIETSELIPHPEVNTHISGKLGDIIMKRNWYYWIVVGKIPLDIAKKLYNDPVGKRDVRVVGDCGCPPPEDPWISYILDGKQLDYESRKPIDWENNCWDDIREELIFVENPAIEPGVEMFIDHYHIDSEVGLRFFADTMKKHGLT